MAANKRSERSWRRLASLLTTLALATALLTGCPGPPESFESTSTVTKQITLTPDTPVAEATFSLGSNQDPSGSGEFRRIKVSFERPEATPVSLSSDSKFRLVTFNIAANDSISSELTLWSASEGSLQFALPEGTQASVEFDVAFEAEASSYDEDIAADFDLEIETGATYDSTLGLLLALDSHARHRLYISAEQPPTGEGILVDNPKEDAEEGDAFADTDGTLTELSDPMSTIPWPEECNDGACQTTVDLYTRDNSSLIKLTSSDPNLNMTVVTELAREERAAIEVADFEYGLKEPTTLDLDINTDPSDTYLGQTVFLRNGLGTGSCRCDASFRFIDRDTGEELGAMTEFEEFSLDVGSNGMLSLQIEVTGTPIEGIEPDNVGGLELNFSSNRFDGELSNLAVAQV